MTKSEATTLRVQFTAAYVCEKWAVVSPNFTLSALDRNYQRWYAYAMQKFGEDYPELHQLAGG